MPTRLTLTLLAVLVGCLALAGGLAPAAHSTASAVLCTDLSIKGINRTVSLNKLYEAEIDLKRSTYLSPATSAGWRWTRPNGTALTGWMGMSYEQSGSNFKYKFKYGRKSKSGLKLQIYITAAMGPDLTDCGYLVNYAVAGK